MSKTKVEPESSAGPEAQSRSRIHRRSFLGRIVGGAAAAAAASTASAQSVTSANSWKAAPKGDAHERLIDAFELRVDLANQDARVPAATNVSNGDEARYRDKAGTYTKALPHDSFGRVDLNAFASFKRALNSGKFSDFEDITMGGTRKLNGPQGGLCFDLEALDSAQFGQPQVPPAPTTASDQNATELLEHYWASLLRDVAFTDYGSNGLAAAAAVEMGAQPTYLGPRDGTGHVTPNLLFRGAFPVKRWGRTSPSSS